MLMLLVIIYLLFLLSVDWINAAGELWYRPFIVGFIVVLVAVWAHRNHESDES
jgi:multisubunit Na+/H+ antiporter MnhE subunit